MLRKVIRQAQTMAQMADKAVNLPMPDWYVEQRRCRQSEATEESWLKYVNAVRTCREPRYWPRFPIFQPYYTQGYCVTSQSAVAAEIASMRRKIGEMHEILGNTGST